MLYYIIIIQTPKFHFYTLRTINPKYKKLIKTSNCYELT